MERQLVQYVEKKIEPAGWKAVWTVPSNRIDSVFKLKQETCVYVDVRHRALSLFDMFLFCPITSRPALKEL